MPVRLMGSRGMVPAPEPHNSVSHTPESTWTSALGVQAAYSSTGPELGRVGPQVDRRLLTIAFPKADAIWREVLDPRKMIPAGSMGEGLITRTLVFLKDPVVL